MRRSIATISLSGTLEDKLEAIAAAGFDAVQIFDNDILYYEDTPRSVLEIAQNLGLAIEGYQPLRDFEGLDEAGFRKCLARAERKLDLMVELGVPLLLVPASTLAASSGDRPRIAAHLRALAEKAASRNIRLAYGPLAWAAHIRSLAEAWAVVEAVGHPHLDVFLSSFQLLAAGDDPKTVSRIPADRIAAVQIADAPHLAIDPVSKSRFYSCLPGEGDLDLTGFVLALLRSGYAGSLTLEIMNEAFRGAPPRIVAEDGMRALRFLEENVRRELEKNKAEAQAAKVALFDPPEPAKISGMEFLEFAASGADAQALGTWFESFGFVNMGKHRSKNVFLYRNGKVNLALNAEPHSFAQSYYLMHGPSVCAIGIRADDDQRALSRGLAFNAQRFEGRVGPNELSIPAIRGQDGSLIYFVGEEDAKNLYEIEFAMKDGAKPEGAALQTVDHLALAVPAGEMDSRVLFYRAVLGFEAAATWLLPDPNGLVKSRAVTSKGHQVRIPLNVSQGRRTATARQVDTQGGAGVHHVAFSCTDIFASVAFLRKMGASLLNIPANYYEDLAMRFELDEAFIAKLKAAHILYDRIGSGEFLHVYSEPYQDRFFFEFVQRIGGYDQYGAANAPFRMAAIARLQRERDRQLTM